MSQSIYNCFSLSVLTFSAKFSAGRHLYGTLKSLVLAGKGIKGNYTTNCRWTLRRGTYEEHIKEDSDVLKNECPEEGCLGGLVG